MHCGPASTQEKGCVCVCGGGAAQGNRVRVKVGRGVALLAHKAGGW